MYEQVVSSIEEFLSVVREYVGEVTIERLAVYRGQRDISWPLVPAIAREPFSSPSAFCIRPDDNTSVESSLFILFRDSMTAMMPAWVSEGTPKEVSWRKLVVAQHLGHE